MRQGIFLSLAALAGVVAGCVAAVNLPNHRAPEPVVTVIDGDEIPLMTRPTRLDIVMYRNDDSLLRCAQMGGRVENATYLTFTCNGVDF